eukprot:232292_1
MSTLFDEVLSLIVCSISTILISVIFCVELLYTIKRIQEQRNKIKLSFYNTYSYYFAVPLTLYLCYIWFEISHLVIWLKISMNCMVFDMLVTMLYVLSKFTMYQFFVLRLHVIYSKSSFQYNPKILIGLALFILIYVSLTITLILLHYSVTLIPGTYINFCRETVPFYIHVYAAIMDQIATFTAVYLFTKPLIYVIKFQMKVNSIDHSEESTVRSNSITPIENTTALKIKKEYDMIVKVSALSFIASISTFIVLLLYVITDKYVLFHVDIFMNSICIMLMNTAYTKLYHRICCGTNKCCQKCILCVCCLQLERNRTKEEIQLSNVIKEETQL